MVNGVENIKNITSSEDKMSQKIEGTRVTVILTKRQFDKMKEIAERHGVSRSNAHRMMVDIGLDSYEIYKGAGVVKLADLVKKAKETLMAGRQLKLF